MKFVFFFLLFFETVFAAPCFSANQKSENTENKNPPLIAVLPFENQSNNIDAPAKIRLALFDAMRKKGFQLLEIEKIDIPLKENFGITDGGQLGSVSPEKLIEKIPAELFCYGTVIDFGFRTAVALSQRKVTVKLKLVESLTGKTVWEKEETGITSRAGTDAAGDFAIHTAGKIFKAAKEGIKKLLPGRSSKKAADMTDKVADVDLTQETYEAVQKLLKEFPK